MAESITPGNIEAHIQGEISGQVAVGSYILQIRFMHGGLINVAAPETQPLPRPRPTPVHLLPRPFGDLLDREAEIGEATTALASGRSVQFYGPAGVGKTSLLRQVAHGLDTRPFPDGIVYLSVSQHCMADLLQSLFDAFYECAVPFKPSDAQLRHYLQGTRAVTLLDHVEFPRDDVEDLMNIASSGKEPDLTTMKEAEEPLGRVAG